MAGDRRSPGGRDRLLLISSLVLALAPKCPLCLLAYAGFLGSSVTLAWSVTSVYGRWLAPLTVACLALSAGGIAVQALRRRAFGPAVLALAAAVAIYAGKFHLDQKPFVFTGMAILAAAAVSVSRPRWSGEECRCAPSTLILMRSESTWPKQAAPRDMTASERSSTQPPAGARRTMKEWAGSGTSPWRS
ncbi:MAG TPA: hypothetical protein VEW48_16970 [Thermoanaerobaculia bacterium]|nr:hypothetical protein [Thermoanaerobaculia bacterium]